MAQVATVTEKRHGIYGDAFYRLSGPYGKGHLDETKFAAPGKILPERPRRWEAWVHENFYDNELVDVLLCLSGCEVFRCRTKMNVFPKHGMKINLSTGWEGNERIHGEYEITAADIGRECCCVYAKLAGPVDETKFLHRVARRY